MTLTLEGSTKVTIPSAGTTGHRQRVAATAWRINSEESPAPSFRNAEQTHAPTTRRHELRRPDLLAVVVAIGENTSGRVGAPRKTPEGLVQCRCHSSQSSRSPDFASRALTCFTVS